jgi:anthranilate synthase component 1
VLRSLPGAHDLLALAAAQPQRYPGLLQSVVRSASPSRWDILPAFPQAELRLDADGHVRDGEGCIRAARFLDALDADWQRERVAAPGEADAGLPFRGGWLLYLGYELAAQIEPRLRLPAAADIAAPTALALRCPAAVLVDHASNRTLLVAEREHAHLLDALADDLAHADRAEVAMLPALQALDEEPPARFLDGVARIHEYLRAGDVFQVNLARAWQARLATAPTPAALYAALRRANPAPFAGLLQWCEWALASSSPERLVEVRGATIQTRPIAGTHPRFAGDDDAARRRELAGHPKERAEHVMLIDLERNDLGRVSVPGSVMVNELMTVESYAHVHHIVSNVRGQLRADVTPGQVIAATFPGGTITGCPKLRCMEIIAELEGVGRGPYTGALGYLDRSGDLDLNILIRSLELRGDAVQLRAGAGIVADSDAARELAETRRKARGLLRALGADG